MRFESVYQCRIGNLEKSCSVLEKSCHDKLKSGKMLEKKIQSFKVAICYESHTIFFCRSI